MSRFVTREGELKIRRVRRAPRLPATKSYSRVLRHYPGGQDHDQQRHGDWAVGYTPEQSAGIERMSKVGPTLQEMIEYAGGDRRFVPLTMEQATLLVNNDAALYDAYAQQVSRLVEVNNPEADGDERDRLEEEALEDDTYMEEFIEDQNIREDFATETEGSDMSDQAMVDAFQEVYGVQVNDPRGAELTTLVDEVRADGGSIVVTGLVRAVTEDGDDMVVGNFERVLTPTPIGLQVEHASFRIDDDQFRGAGLGRKFIEQSEDWYIAKGADAIMLQTGWDGAYTWSKAGFDFYRPALSTTVSALVNRVRNGSMSEGHYGVALSPEELDVWNGLLERSVNNLQISGTAEERRYDYERVKDINDPDFPLPAEFARAPRAKELMNGLAISMTKYLTPEGRSLADGPIDRDGDGMVYDGTPRERPARPSETAVAAAKWGKRDSKLRAIAEAYSRFGGDFDDESRGGGADSPELDRAIAEILG